MIISIIKAYLWIGIGVAIANDIITDIVIAIGERMMFDLDFETQDTIYQMKHLSTLKILMLACVCIFAWPFYIAVNIYTGYRSYKRVTKNK